MLRVDNNAEVMRLGWTPAHVHGPLHGAVWSASLRRSLETDSDRYRARSGDRRLTWTDDPARPLSTEFCPTRAGWQRSPLRSADAVKHRCPPRRRTRLEYRLGLAEPHAVHGGGGVLSDPRPGTDGLPVPEERLGETGSEPGRAV